MCLINDEVEQVSDTKLFVSKSSDAKRQITVYANNVANKIKNNAMVLPVPDPDSVKFHDLTNMPDFFDECDKHFYKLESNNRSYGFSTNSFDLESDSLLEVFEVGSYSISLAKNISDLKRVNSAVFNLSDGLHDVLNKNYSGKNMGFIICKLKIGNEKYHPLAYSHSFIGKLYVPTKHYHYGDNEQSTSVNNESLLDDNFSFGNFARFDSTPMKDDRWTHTKLRFNLDSNLADDWDHDIYVVNYAKDSTDNSYMTSFNSSKYLWDKKFDLNLKKYGFDLPDKIYNFEKLVIQGEKKNVDLMIAVN